VRSRSNLLVLLGIAFFIVGGVIVYLITNDDDDGAEAAAQVQVVVASGDVAPGELADDLIADGRLRTEEIDASNLVPGAIGSLNQLAGAVFTQGFSADQQITSGGLQLQPPRTFEIPEGFDAVALQLEFVSGVAGYVNPGDRINLYGTIGGRAELVLTNVEVLDVDLSIPPRRGTTAPEGQAAPARAAAGAVTYLVALRPDDVEKAVYISEFQGMYASLVREEAPPAGPTPGQDANTILEEEPNVAFNG
jgi:Flp pilus assembly protein CpaB